jgi:hypothetical protein
MRMKRMWGALCLLLALALAGCGIGGIQDVKAKTENLETKDQLEKTLGKPTNVSGGSALGFSADTYVYETSDGTATFVIVNGKIKSKLYGSKETK